MRHPPPSRLFDASVCQSTGLLFQACITILSEVTKTTLPLKGGDLQNRSPALSPLLTVITLSCCLILDTEGLTLPRCRIKQSPALCEREGFSTPDPCSERLNVCTFSCPPHTHSPRKGKGCCYHVILRQILQSPVSLCLKPPKLKHRERDEVCAGKCTPTLGVLGAFTTV